MTDDIGKVVREMRSRAVNLPDIIGDDMRDWADRIESTAADFVMEHGPAIRQAMIDARRYRFLRRKDAWKETYLATTGGISAIFVSDGRTGHATDTEMLDAAIDARLASDSEGGE